MQPTNYETFLATHGGPDAQPSSNTNWLANLLPTAGSVIGGIGGALIPGLGETGIGEVGGAAAGSAAGKALEDVFTGKHSNLGELGGAALEGGIGQGVGMGVGKLAGGILGKLGTAGEETAAQKATAESMNSEFGGVSKPTRDKFNMNSNAGKFSEYGLPFDNNTIGRVAPIVTGSAESPAGQAILHKGTVAAMQGAKPVDVTGVQSLAQRIGKSPDLETAGTNVGKAFINEIATRLGEAQLPGDLTANGSVGSLLKTHAPTVFETMQTLERQAQDTKNPALSKAYSDVAQALDQALQKAGANDVAAKGLYTPEDLQALSQVSPKLAQEAANVTTVGENRSLQAPFVQASFLSRAAGKAAEGQLPSVEQAPSVLGQVAQAGHGLVTGNVPAKVGALSSLGKVGAPILKQLASMGASVAKAGGAASLPKVASQVVSHGPEYTNAPAGGVAPQGGQPPMQPQVPGQEQANPMGGDMNAVTLGNQLDRMLAADPNLASSLGPILAQLMPQIQKTNAATAALGGYQQTLGQAGGPQGPAGGLLSQLGGLFTGGPAAQVGPQQAQAAAALANATGMTQEQALAALPGLGANAGGASAGFGTAGSILGALQ
jgi:hypothetical protein